MKHKIGDQIDILTKSGGKYIGLFIPSHNKNIISIKLDSGYNIGINKTKIKKIKLLKKSKQVKLKTKKITKNQQLKNITILHTGGTIASQVDYNTGGVISKFTPEEIVAMFPELEQIVNIDSKLIAEMWSDDARFYHYNKLAKEIQKQIKKGIDGIIITSGTDTLHYTSAALTFILENINIPVLIVGAQRSSDRGSSDAGMNLICAAQFISKTNFVGIASCLHSTSSDNSCDIIHGCKVRKMHTSRRDAFKSINTEPVAIVNNKGQINYLSNYTKKHNQELKLRLFKENLKVGLLKIHTNMYPEQFSVYKNFKGLVIEGTGLGHTPGDVIDDSTRIHKNIINEIKKLLKSTTIAMASQCIYGRINMNVYSKGRILKELGIIGDQLDMTPETSFIKLAWLLSNYKKQEVKILFHENLRGELTKRILYKEDFQ